MNRIVEVRLNLQQIRAATATRASCDYANRYWHYDTRYYDTSISVDAPHRRARVGRKERREGQIRSPRRSASAARARGARRLERRLDARAASLAGPADAGAPGGGATRRAALKPPATPAVTRARIDLGAHRAPRLHADRDARRAADPRDHVRARLRHLPRGAASRPQHTEESLKRTREIEFGMRMMVQDFAELVPRPIRDPLGQSRQPSLLGGTGERISSI